MADDESKDLLVVIFDVNPFWWGGLEQELDHQGHFLSTIEAVLVFCNTHLLLKQQNELAVICCGGLKNTFAYPSPVVDERNLIQDGKFEPFIAMNEQIANIVKQCYNEKNETDTANRESNLSGALAMALCYIQRQQKNVMFGNKFKSHILVIKGSPDSSSQYMSIMNCIFAAQKNFVTIDACSLIKDSGFMQQAADITGGLYFKAEQLGGLLQYLLWMFVGNQDLRKQFILPKSTQIDYRAACFCHRKLVDVGFVCSVCLSIYCQFLPWCKTCETRFKMPALPKSRKRKKESQ